VKKLSKLDENDLERFMHAEGMIKNKFKMRAVIKNHKDGEVSQELVKTEGGLNIVKRIAEKDMGQKVVSLSHILICYKGASNCETGTLTKEQAKAKLEEVKKEATAANFADLAKKPKRTIRLLFDRILKLMLGWSLKLTMAL
jgi:3-methyladenine DNA glycosylase Tag